MPSHVRVAIVLVALGSCAVPGLARPLHIVHLGDSITQTPYLPVSQRIETLTQVSFRAKFGTEDLYCYNVSKGGRDISEFIGVGGWYYFHCRNIIPIVDVAFIQFGINDEDAYGPDEFERQTNLFCDLVEADYPGVQIVLCTSMQTKNPSWYDSFGGPPYPDEPININNYARTRKVAAERGYQLVDIYAITRALAEAGQWSFRLSATDLHPTAYGVELIAAEETRVLEIAALRPTMIGAKLFYNRSAFDGNDPAANAADDAAIATDKQALRPGQAASFAHYTSYSRGINGIMVDIDFLPATPTAADFAFKVGNDPNTAGWTAGPAPLSVTVRSGAGEALSDRITIVFADGAITNRWLQMTVLATAQTGLENPEVFYFGNAIAETGNSPGDAKVTPTDYLRVRANPCTARNNPAAVTNPYDFNRDRRVSPIDQVLVRMHGVGNDKALQLITAP